MHNVKRVYIKIIRVHVLLILMLKNFQEQFKTFVDKTHYCTLKTFSQLAHSIFSVPET